MPLPRPRRHQPVVVTAADAKYPVHDLLARVRQHCLALPEVTEGLTHGAPTWFVRGKRSFAKFIDPDEHPRFDEVHVAFWAAAPFGAKQDLTSTEPDRFFVPPFGGSDWVGMRLDLEAGGPDWDDVHEIITDAYRQVAPKTLLALLDKAAPGS